MTSRKWDKLFLFDEALELPGHPYGGFDFTHMFTLNDNFYPGANRSTITWYREPIPDWQLYRPHVDNCDEIIGYFGSNPKEPFDLGADVSINIEGEQYDFSKSCLLFIPQGVEHEPWLIKKMNRPIVVVHMYSLSNFPTWHGTSAKDPKWSKYPEFPGREYIKLVNLEDISPKSIAPPEYLMKIESPLTPVHEKGRYWKNFIFNPIPGLGHTPTPAFTHLFNLGEKHIEGSNFTFCVMFREPLPQWQRFRCHVHADNETLCYIGMNPEDPFDLGAEIEIYIDDEPYTFDRSCLLFMPAGIPHVPWRIKKVTGKGFLGVYTHSSTISSTYMGPSSREKRWSHLPFMEAWYKPFREN